MITPVKDFTVSRRKIQLHGGVVVLPIAEYEKLRRQAVPDIVLEGRSAKKLDQLVEQGLRDYRRGKTQKISF